MDSTYILLQHYWWFLVSLLGALLVFLLFVQGGQSLLFTIGKTEIQQKMLLNSTGRNGSLLSLRWSLSEVLSSPLSLYFIPQASAEPIGYGC